MAQLNMKEAIRDALRVELKRDPNVLLFGEDVGNVGGVFRVTEGLQKEFGEERVFDTPLAESAIGGLAVGLGIQGFRPVAEIQFVGFIFEALDQMVVQNLLVCVSALAVSIILQSYSVHHSVAALKRQNCTQTLWKVCSRKLRVLKW